MFVGNMVTEAIPARVFALYKIVENKKSIPRNELQALMEPPEIYEGTSYFSVIFKTATELKLVNERVYEYGAISDSNMLNLLSERTGETIKAPMIRGWRFWSQFLGFGCMNGFTFLPNAYVYCKNVISLLNLEKKTEYPIDVFMSKFMQYGKVILSEKTGDRNFNIAMSSALRELHDNGEIVLKFGSDQDMKWILYPSKELFNQPVSSIVYKGVKRE